MSIFGTKLCTNTKIKAFFQSADDSRLTSQVIKRRQTKPKMEMHGNNSKQLFSGYLFEISCTEQDKDRSIVCLLNETVNQQRRQRRTHATYFHIGRKQVVSEELHNLLGSDQFGVGGQLDCLAQQKHVSNGNEWTRPIGILGQDGQLLAAELYPLHVVDRGVFGAGFCVRGRARGTRHCKRRTLILRQAVIHKIILNTVKISCKSTSNAVI